MKKENGITLVAMVITIIVLLILAIVSINLVMNGGIIDRAEKGTKAYTEAEIGEQIKLAYSEYQLSQYSDNTENVNEFIKNRLNNTLENIEDVNKTGNTLMVTFSNGKVYTCNVLTGKTTDLSNKTNISKDTNENFVGYYADIDADGIVDGVIFADLLVGNTNGNQWGTNGEYTISNVNSESLKNYYISKKNHEGIFGIKDVLSPKGSGGNRFYVMSLNNFTAGEYNTFYWYKNVLSKMNPLVTENYFGKGKTNTGTMIDKWNVNGETGGYTGATQDNEDIWKYIQTKYKEGWFIPSKDEWAAFSQELGIIGASGGNYNTYGLNNSYWSSSQAYTWGASWDIEYGNKRINYTGVGNKCYVRLATTF